MESVEERTEVVELQTEPFVLNVGPSHPSTHGVFRLRTVFDGEVVVEMEPLFGYLHRGIEKLGETRTYAQIIPLTDRFDYLASMTNNVAYCMAVEKLAGITVPERGEYVRIIVSEFMRLSSHLMANAFLFNEMGCFITPIMQWWREREKMLDLFEMLCGQRLTYNYFRIGGVSQDFPPGFLEKLNQFVDEMPGWMDEYDEMMADNEIVHMRMKGIGVIAREDAINYSMTGPMARASGVNRDLRRDDPYSIYDRFGFDVITREEGDNYARWRVRVDEMRQSLRILKQALRDLPSGEVRADVPRLLRPPVGEVFGHIEAPKGELGYYLVSDNSIAPYRFHVRSPVFINLGALPYMAVGWKIADAIMTCGTFDICMGEVDR